MAVIVRWLPYGVTTILRFHCDVTVDLGNGELTNDVPFFAIVKGRDSLPDLKYRALFDALTVHQIEGASRVVAA